jgi:hypothetical protein
MFQNRNDHPTTPCGDCAGEAMRVTSDARKVVSRRTKRRKNPSQLRGLLRTVTLRDAGRDRKPVAFELELDRNPGNHTSLAPQAANGAVFWRRAADRRRTVSTCPADGTARRKDNLVLLAVDNYRQLPCHLPIRPPIRPALCMHSHMLRRAKARMTRINSLISRLPAIASAL